MIDQQPDVDDILAAMETGMRDVLALEPHVVGIHTGGAWLAERLHRTLGLQEPMGLLDISFYRDDFTRIGINPQVRTSDLPVDIDDRHILLVDDVLHTGRTTRAAMNVLFDYGRPRSIILAVGIERDGRELPIQPDIVGMHLRLSANRYVKLQGPDELGFTISEKTS
ncbi:MAG: bifunctional pyr operon transcriptional regulator/uracil phosphoribosyltransferase PyrR [Gammaproteobacteria bacterium]|nr:bifunctional pyr operon transcriptional regulator/uracil phosphoribosyltransferase PyrR [Gammaproteobacteria bacterium]